MSLLSFEEAQFREKSEIFGRLFMFSIEKGYDSELFVKQLMTDSDYTDMLVFDNRFEWSDDHVLMAYLEDIKPFKVGDRHEDQFTMWFMGYLYKYWIATRKMLPSEVYKILPFESFIAKFPFYHTQGWLYIIENEMNSYQQV